MQWSGLDRNQILQNLPGTEADNQKFEENPPGTSTFDGWQDNHHMVVSILFTLFLVFMNGFFVAAEFAIVKVRESQLEVEARNGNSAAILARKIIRNIDGYLAATQLGITLASLGLGWVGEPVVARIITAVMASAGIQLDPETAHDWALPIAFALITVLHIVFGELAPKSIAIQRSEKTVLMVAYPLRFFFVVFTPFIWLLNGIANFILRSMGIAMTHESEVHSSEELRYLVTQGKESGTIEEENYQIIKNAFDFSERNVRQVMVPRPQVMAIDVQEFDAKVLETVLDAGYSRIPCYEETLDKVVGVVYLKDLLMKMRKKEKIRIADLMRPIMTIPESKPIGRLLKEFQLKHQQMAVVVNEYGSTKGIITMEDILEELVGEIQDEFDNEVPVVERISEGVYSVLASATLHDINKSLPNPIENDGNYETLAGYIIYKCGRIPNTDETFFLDPYEITILKKIKSSLVLVRLKDQTPPAEEGRLYV
jgi:CBS domain containing-hemolysin-like protein